MPPIMPTPSPNGDRSHPDNIDIATLVAVRAARANRLSRAERAAWRAAAPWFAVSLLGSITVLVLLLTGAVR
jgi:hypothetical protein